MRQYACNIARPQCVAGGRLGVPAPAWGGFAVFKNLFVAVSTVACNDFETSVRLHQYEQRQGALPTIRLANTLIHVRVSR